MTSKRCPIGTHRNGSKCVENKVSNRAQELFDEIDNAQSRDELEEVSSRIESAYDSMKISEGEFDALQMEIKHFQDKFERK